MTNTERYSIYPTSTFNWIDKKHLTILDPQSYKINESGLNIEKGLLGKSATFTPLFTIKRTYLCRTALQRCLGLCTIYFYTYSSKSPIIMENMIYDAESYDLLLSEIHRQSKDMFPFHYYS